MSLKICNGWGPDYIACDINFSRKVEPPVDLLLYSEYCERLAVISDDKDNKYAADACPLNERCVIGFVQPYCSREFVWMDWSTYNHYTNWAPGYPKNTTRGAFYVTIDRSGTWTHVPDYKPYQGICVANGGYIFDECTYYGYNKRPVK